MKLVVWGLGKDFHSYKEELKGNELWFIDSDISKQGNKYEGKKIETPDSIIGQEYDYIIVASRKYYEEIVGILTNKYHVAYGKIILISEFKKEMLLRSIGQNENCEKKKIKILFGYCYLIFENCRINDFLLAESLRRRGAEIIPLVCDGVQENQCSAYGGQWGNPYIDLEEKRNQHSKNCIKCKRCSEKVWKYWGNYDVVSAKEYITNEERQKIKDTVEEYNILDVMSWRYEDYPIGEWTLRTYYNIELISTKERYNEIETATLKSLAYNVILMCIVTERCVNEINPDIIYSNCSYYYPYCILEHIAKRNKKPFYNAYSFRKDSYSYAKDEVVLNMPLKSAWESFSKRGLTDKESRFIREYIEQRKNGSGMLVDFANVKKSIANCRKDAIHGTIAEGKKKVLLASNITWDAAALFKGVVFDNIIEWVLETVEFFEKHSEWQLIVRAHPAEIVKNVPPTREPMGKIVLEKYNYNLPDNIVVIESDAPISIYDLYPIVDMGLVYTSTVGIELSCLGIPVITTGKAPYRDTGVTFDPQDKEMYFDMIKDILSKKQDREGIAKRAQTFFFLYFFVYMFQNPFYNFSWENGAELLFSDEKILDEGKDELWDYICDSIMNGEEILSKDRIIPYKIEDMRI